MPAILIKPAKGAAGLELADIPRPALGPKEIRVRVVASSVNRADLLSGQALIGRSTGPDRRSQVSTRLARSWRSGRRCERSRHVIA